MFLALFVGCQSQPLRTQLDNDLRICSFNLTQSNQKGEVWIERNYPFSKAEMWKAIHQVGSQTGILLAVSNEKEPSGVLFAIPWVLPTREVANLAVGVEVDSIGASNQNVRLFIEPRLSKVVQGHLAEEKTSTNWSRNVLFSFATAVETQVTSASLERKFKSLKKE